jgi:hypothetical protein
VIEALGEGPHGERADRRVKKIFVLDGVISNAADPMKLNNPEQPFGHNLKGGIRFLAGLADLPPIDFVADRESVVVGRPPGRARGGGAIVSLGPIEGAGSRVEVGVNTWSNSLAATWLTYVIEEKDGHWKVTGTTGPMAIS